VGSVRSARSVSGIFVRVVAVTSTMTAMHAVPLSVAEKTTAPRASTHGTDRRTTGNNRSAGRTDG
jgi:hypothetical protein